MSRYLWMKVTFDEYQFPIEIADSVHELARLTGAKVQNIRCCVSKLEHGKSKRSHWVRVRMEEEEDEDY